MNQTIAWSTFASGGVTFLATATEMLAAHNSWNYFYETPLGAIHGVVLGMAFVAMIGGALKAQLPRADNVRGDRKGD